MSGFVPADVKEDSRRPGTFFPEAPMSIPSETFLPLTGASAEIVEAPNGQSQRPKFASRQPAYFWARIALAMPPTNSLIDCGCSQKIYPKVGFISLRWAGAIVYQVTKVGAVCRVSTQ